MARRPPRPAPPSSEAIRDAVLQVLEKFGGLPMSRATIRTHVSLLLPELGTSNRDVELRRTAIQDALRELIELGKADRVDVEPPKGTPAYDMAQLGGHGKLTAYALRVAPASPSPCLVVDLRLSGILHKGCKVQGSGGLLPAGPTGLRRLEVKLQREEIVRVYTKHTASEDVWIDVPAEAIEIVRSA